MFLKVLLGGYSGNQEYNPGPSDLPPQIWSRNKVIKIYKNPQRGWSPSNSNLIFREPGGPPRIGERPERPMKLRLAIGDLWTRLKGRDHLAEEPTGFARIRLMEEAAWLAVECGGRSQAEVARYFK